jgi:hypothetical protein
MRGAATLSLAALAALAALATAACSAAAEPASRGDADARRDAGHALLVPVDASFPATLDTGSTASSRAADAGLDTPRPRAEADAGTDGPSRFVTSVVSFHQGTCAGYGASGLPGIVEGPPQGGGAVEGSVDVVSLGGGGSIVVGFAPNAIVDGPGVDFVVFENPFDYGNGDRYVEPGEVSVSDDGVTWTAFPCTDTTQAMPDGGWGATRCGGMNLVYSNPFRPPYISPFDLQRAGGDQYDLASIGVKHARYVRIRNVVATEPCPEGGLPDGEVLPDKNGFDLDAIAIINGEL